MISKRFVPQLHRLALCFVLLLAFVLPVRAQWLTQSFVLTNGWNAIYVNVDASYTSLNKLVASDTANPILEVWRWHPSTTLQFSDNPQNPLDTDSQWSSWERTDPAGSSLQRMVGNSAYLVHVGTNVSTFTWHIKGKAVAPVNQWTTSGLNFIGFPTVPANPPTFESFFSQAPALQQNPATQIFYYRGGDLSSNNPAQVIAYRSVKVSRGQAFWVRSGTTFNSYFGPFELSVVGPGLDFNGDQRTVSFLLKNLTSSNLTITGTLNASENPPSGQPHIAGTPPLLVRGNLNFTNLTYGFTNLPLHGRTTWNLAPLGQPGSQVEVVVGFNQSSLTNNPGDFLAGILRFTDSLGFSQIDAPVSAVVRDNVGLWIGKALISEVGQYLKNYIVDSFGNRVILSNGQYRVVSTNTSWGPVPQPYSLRLIVHNPAAPSTNAVLLQRVFMGVDAATNPIVATKESLLNQSYLKVSRRISSAHFPFSEINLPWPLNGTFNSSTSLTTSVILDYADQASNPFLHSFHPDHDNIDATFKNILPQGSESYSIRRDIILNINPPTQDFASQVAGTQTITGDYLETISLLGLARGGGSYDTRQFQVRGAFTLNRLSSIPLLTTAP